VKTQGRLPVGRSGGQKKLRNALPSALQLLQQTQDGVIVVRIPLRRNFSDNLGEHAFGDAVFQALEPEAKGFHAGYAFINAVACIQAAQGRIGEIPLPGVEAEALVDHQRAISRRIPVTRVGRSPGNVAWRCA